ncbi:MAG: hypothetical protein AAGE52_40285 [Myxococcota bacterium]
MTLPPRERRISTPVVLIATSAMVCIGVVGVVIGNQDDAPEEGAVPGVEVLVDTSTPERAAESFLDAWRKRAHPTALGLAVGLARDEVEERRDRDEALSDHERELKAQVWDAMAQDRLRLLFSEAENLDAGRLRLGGTTTGTFLGSPYEREMEFVMQPSPEGWRVEAFRFGEILSEVPRNFEIEP